MSVATLFPLDGVRPALERSDAPRLKTLGSLLGLVVDLLSLDQLAIARTFDGREVCEDVGSAVVRGDEPEALVALNHFTVPAAMVLPLFSTRWTLRENLVATGNDVRHA